MWPLCLYVCRVWAYNDGSRGRGLECAGRRADRLPEAYGDGDTLGFLLDIPVGGWVNTTTSKPPQTDIPPPEPSKRFNTPLRHPVERLREEGALPSLSCLSV